MTRGWIPCTYDSWVMTRYDGVQNVQPFLYHTTQDLDLSRGEKTAYIQAALKLNVEAV